MEVDNQVNVDQSVCPANLVSFEEFCTLCEKIYNNKKNRQQQDAILTEYIDNFRAKIAMTSGITKDTSFFPILRLLLPKQDRKRPAYDLKEEKLGKLYAEKVLNLNKMSRDGQKLLNYRSARGSQHGSDFASVAHSVLQSLSVCRQGDLTVGEVNKYLDRIANAEAGTKAKTNVEVFTEVVWRTTPLQHKWWLRIVLKDMKWEMGHVRVLACFHPDAPEMFDLCQDLHKICSELDQGDSRPLELGVRLFSAICPMLSERLDVTKLGRLPPARYIVENKFDGERFQLHMKNGEFDYFSRKGHSYKEQYGGTYASGALTERLREVFDPAAESFVLDGEMMGWHKECERFSSKGMAFDVKKITANSKFQPCFVAFDSLYYNGRCLAGSTDGALILEERLRLLDTLFTDVPGTIVKSVRENVANNEEILVALNKAIESDDEGIIVKDLDSYYVPNKRNAGWYKVKPEYTDGVMVDLDLMVVGADYAQNSARTGLVKSFSLALADASDIPGEMPQRWLSFGKVASGITHEERQQLCTELSQHWVPIDKSPPPSCLHFSKEKPELWIHPQHSVILQVKASELIKTTYFAAGYTLRFPRISKIRRDKPLKDAMTVQEMEALVQGRRAVEKLTNRQITLEELSSEPRPSRKRRSNPLEVAPVFRPAARGHGDELEQGNKTNVLRGKKIAVISGDGVSTKEELEKMVMACGGIPVQNIGADTWLCVAGRKTQRVQNAIAARVDVARADWLRAIHDGGANMADVSPKPLHLLSTSQETELKLSRKYNVYGDSYTEELDEDTLKLILRRMDEMPRYYPTTDEKLQLDQELFNGESPYSCLRGCRIYIDLESTRLRIIAQALAAKVYDTESEDLTHVVWDDKVDYKEFLRGTDAKVVREEWIEQCLKYRRRVDETPYVV